MSRPTTPFWNNEAPPALIPGLNDRETAILDYVDEKAPIADPTFTGTPEAPDPPDADNTQKLATTAWTRRYGASIGGSTAGNDFVNLTSSDYNIRAGAGYEAANTAALIDAAYDEYITHGRANSPGRKLYLPGNSSNYLFDRTKPAYPFSLVGDGFGSTVLGGYAIEVLVAEAFDTGSNPPSGAQAVTATINAGTNVITNVASTSGMVRGQWLLIGSQDQLVPNGGTGSEGEFVRIRDIPVAGTINLWGSVEETYTYTPGSMRPWVKVCTPWNGCTFEGFTTLNTDTGHNQTNGNWNVLSLRGLVNSYVHVESISWGLDAAIMLDCCLDSDFILHTRDGDDWTYPPANAQGYGVLLWQANQNCHVTCHVKRHRHGFTTGGDAFGEPRHCKIYGTFQECTGTAADTHKEGRFITFENVEISRSNLWAADLSSDWGAAFQTRARDLTIRGGSVRNVCTWAVQGAGGANLKIDGLHIYGVLARAADGNSSNGIDSDGPGAFITNCYIEGINGGPCINVDANNATLTNNVMKRTAGARASAIANASGTGHVGRGNIARGGYTSVWSSTTNVDSLGDFVAA